MVTVDKCGQMDHTTRATGVKVKLKVLEFFTIKMVIRLKVTSTLIKLTGKAALDIKVGKNMKVTGSMTFNMEMVKKF